MALQINPREFKAKRRIIKSATGETLSRTKTTKELYKERRKRAVAVDGRSRYELTDRSRVVKSARQKQGRAIARGAYQEWINPPRPDTGANLKKGIEGMALRAGLVAGVDDILYAKLLAMDESRLAQLYARNELIFDVAFNYGGSLDESPMDQRNPQARNVIPGKKSDLEFLVEQYEKAFGPLLV